MKVPRLMSARCAAAALACALGALMATFYLVGPTTAQDDPCEPSVLRLATPPPLGYAPRGERRDRCEGEYRQEKRGSPTLSVVSLTAGVEDFDPRSNVDLRVEWAPLTDAPVRLRAQSLRPRQYYRMDALRPPGETSFLWPPWLLGDLDIRRSELGIVAWTRRTVGGRPHDVYLAVRIGQRDLPRSAPTYELVVVPGVELSELYQTLVPLGSDGRPGRPLWDGAALALGYYPANRPIRITISGLASPGFYRLDLGGLLRHRGTTSTSFVFYRP